MNLRSVQVSPHHVSSILGAPGEASGIQVMPRPPARRLEARDVLTPAQAKVLEVVAEHAGCTIRHVAQMLRVSHATASYHLFALSRLGLLVQVRDGREVRHFPGQRGPGSAAYVEALMQDGRKARILRVLALQPVERMTMHEVAKAATVNFAFLKRTLQQLEWAQVVRLERRRYRYCVRVSPLWQDQLRSMLQD